MVTHTVIHGVVKCALKHAAVTLTCLVCVLFLSIAYPTPPFAALRFG